MNPIITLNTVNLTYNNKIIFNNLNYQFKNTVYIIKGESGIGKTTLLNLRAGYILPNSGNISIQLGK